MSDTEVPAKPPLDEVMLAMDVVDTLRHRERVVERELAADERDRALLTRLKEIYAGQGIEVSDAVLERGIRDLHQNRFAYTPPAPSVSRTLARIYVTRSRWGAPVTVLVAIVAVVLVSYQLLIRGPRLAAIEALPAELEQSYEAVVAVTEDPAIETRAANLLGDGRLALIANDPDALRVAIGELDGLHDSLVQEYELRVRSEPGQLSGVWRIPDANPDAQNFYLIVEAIDADGKRLTLPIRNEESGRVDRVSVWGQRVDEATFQAIARDKQDDGIIQNAVIGEKRRGQVEPDLKTGVLQGAITHW
jgi:hypothetical protein